VTIKLPPLRERREDITLLAHHFAREMAQRHGKQITGIAAEVRRVLTAYDWPGNVRELRNVIDSMVVHDRDGLLGVDDLPEGELLQRAQGPVRPTLAEGSLIGKPLEEVERFYIQQALELTNGNREEAAKMLGIGERTLYRKIKAWGLNVRKRGQKTSSHSLPNATP